MDVFWQFLQQCATFINGQVTDTDTEKYRQGRKIYRGENNKGLRWRGDGKWAD